MVRSGKEAADLVLNSDQLPTVSSAFAPAAADPAPPAQQLSGYSEGGYCGQASPDPGPAAAPYTERAVQYAVMQDNSSFAFSGAEISLHTDCALLFSFNFNKNDHCLRRDGWRGGGPL